MNSLTKNGGAAFPIVYDVPAGVCGRDGSTEDVDRRCIEGGMTLRDWFAGQAMQGFCADPSSHHLFNDKNDMADSAYGAADAMLAAREGGRV